MKESVKPIHIQNKNLLLKNFVWKENFNAIVLSISRKINSDSNNFKLEINDIRKNLIQYCTSKGWLNIGTDLEKDFLLRWCNNTIVMLQCASEQMSLFDLLIRCITYNSNSINEVGRGHASEAQYSFSMLCVLDRIKKRNR